VIDDIAQSHDQLALRVLDLDARDHRQVADAAQGGLCTSPWKRQVELARLAPKVWSMRNSLSTPDCVCSYSAASCRQVTINVTRK
jgi:hypothetical protein